MMEEKNSNTEEWKEIPEYEGMYSVSNLGRIRSEPRMVAHILDGKFLRGKILKSRINKQTGYPAVNLSRNSKKKTFPVHVLVAISFLGKRPNGMEVAHGDGNRINAKLTNLRYKTSLENSQDALHHGTVARGERLPQSKLTGEKVVQIRKDGRLQREIAAEYGVSITTISQIKSRIYWSHVD